MMLRLCLVFLLLAGMTATASAQAPGAAAPQPQAAAPQAPPSSPAPQAATPDAKPAELPKGPSLAELMKQSAYRGSWEAMLRAETVPPPEWITAFVSTLDSPPTPSIEVPVGTRPYRMAFTCKPNDCENNQIFVLFAPEGRHAWALLLSVGAAPRWLGNPDDEIKGAIKSSLE